MYLIILTLTLMRTEVEITGTDMLGNHTKREVQAEQRSSLFPFNPEKAGGMEVSWEKIWRAALFMSKQLTDRSRGEWTEKNPLPMLQPTMGFMRVK